MKTFFTSLFYAAIAGGVAVAVGGKAYEKHLRYLVALLCTALTVSPLLSVVNAKSLSLPQGQSYVSADAEAAEKLIASQMEADAEKHLADYIFSETGINPTSVSIQIETYGGEAQIKSVKIKTPRDGDRSAVRECVTSLLKDVPIEVTDG